jgi:two-component system copper resistance phosphate regulon response regulator CusR
VKVLLIDDSERLRRSLEHGLHRSGFAVEAVEDGETGLAYARRGGYDVVVLDLMLPKMDGLTVLRRLRESDGRTHVLILSAKDQVAERIEGLQLGADDYLTKPFAFDELVARLRALIRRKYGAKNPVHEVGELRIDTSRKSVVVGRRPVALTRNEYSLLEYLLARRGSVVPKSELLDHLYAEAGEGSENAVEVFIHQLRKKIQPTGQPEVIVTRRGHGYLIE